MTTFYRPVRTNRITQKFGENIPCVKLGAGGFPLRPFRILIPKALTCPPGYTKFYPLVGLSGGHNGIDLGAWHGEPVYHSAMFSGKMECEVDKDGGIGVRVFADIPDETGNYPSVLYWHLKRVAGHDGKQVNPGDLIGYADSTGSSSGDHVHWALKYCDKDRTTLNKGNGFAGAVSMGANFKNEFILDVLQVKPDTLSVLQLAEKTIFEVRQFLESFKQN